MKISVWAILLIFLAATGHAKTVERIVAIVNDQIVTLSDLESFKKTSVTGGLVDEALSGLFDMKAVVKDRDLLVNYLIDERLMDSEVKKRNLSVTIERVEQEIRSITQRNQISRAQLKQALEAKGVVFSDYQNFVKTTLERQSLIEREVSSRIKISDDDIAAHYLANKGKSDLQVFEYTLSHILFRPSNGGEAAAIQRAENVRKKLSPENFNKMAAQYSEDPNFAQDGLLGKFRASDMVKEMADAVRNLDVGDFTVPVKTRMGIHILKVDKRSLVEDPRLQAEKEQIRGQLFAQAFKKQLRQWLDQKREDSFIRINK